MTIYAATQPELGLVAGIIGGLAFMGVLYGFDILFRRFNLRSFNIAVIGLFVGYLMGQALVLIFDATLDFTTINEKINAETVEVIKIAMFLFGLYLGTLMTLKSSDELYISIPFVRFSHTSQQKKDLIIDGSVLCDTRIIDLCASGLLDHHLVVPRFVVKELYAQETEGSKRALEVLKKLEGMSRLKIRTSESDFPDTTELKDKIVRLARLLDANVLTADISQIDVSNIEGIQFINMHALSNALKPLKESGESLHIKIQRPGKEPRQGVGYLDDGTMVVVNGGGDYIGETIEVDVLSVKHTSSGRIIFCNAHDADTNT